LCHRVAIMKPWNTLQKACYHVSTTVFLGILYPSDSCTHSPQNYVRFRTTRLQKECPYLILWKKNPGISLKRQVIWIPHVESYRCMYNSNNQKTSLNLHFPVFEVSARWSFFTDSLYPSDIFDEDVVGFLHPSVYIWGVQNTEKYGSAVDVDVIAVVVPGVSCLSTAPVGE
jgi:hypothetical protein